VCACVRVRVRVLRRLSYNMCLSVCLRVCLRHSLSLCLRVCVSVCGTVCPSVGRSVDGASGTDPVTVRIQSRYGYRIIITDTFFIGMFSSFIMCECMCVRVRACACVCVRVRACACVRACMIVWCASQALSLFYSVTPPYLMISRDYM
jgi:hypothetical protein